MSTLTYSAVGKRFELLSRGLQSERDDAVVRLSQHSTQLPWIVTKLMGNFMSSGLNGLLSPTDLLYELAIFW